MSGDIQTNTQLVIAIDFGTTFTGVAYMHQGAQPEVDPHRIADRITVVRRWPNATGTFVEKTPSKIAYHTNPPAWGRQVRPTDQPQASFFKLGLEPRTEDYYRDRDPQAYSLIRASRATIQNKEPIDIAADYLTCVYAHVRQIFKDQFGETFLDTQPTIYVITVPAIWSDYAQNQTKEAARRAGIPLDRLRLVTEPEAAAHYCATKCEELDLVEGDRFVVCDAGGGTVDLISYELFEYPNFQIGMCIPATGGPCGAMHLDSRFETLIRNKLGQHATRILTEERLTSIRNYFERTVKLEFNHYSSECDPEWPIPFPRLPDVPEIGIRNGYLMVRKEEIATQVFGHVFAKIYSLIMDQMRGARTAGGVPIKALFLVGGLGSSSYLAEYLRKQFETRSIDIRLIQPDDGVTAIMKGAVLNRLGLKLVKFRVMRYSYGLVSEPVFKSGEHPEHLKYRDKVDGNDRCKGVMKWYALMGTRVEDANVVRHNFVANFSKMKFRFNRNLPLKCSVLISELDPPPKFRNEHVKRLCTLELNLKDLPDGAFTLFKGPKGEFHQARFDLAIKFDSVVTLQLMHGDIVVRRQTSEYAVSEIASATITSETLQRSLTDTTVVGRWRS